jgi:uncharacterized protein
MTSLSFPDSNVWLAILCADHNHRPAAVAWWNATKAETIAFNRITQLGVLRLLSNDKAMNGNPLTNTAAWAAHDRLFEDDRVAMMNEPGGLETHFRQHSAAPRSSSKLWADAYLTAFAHQTGAELVTFDQTLAANTPNSLLLG